MDREEFVRRSKEEAEQLREMLGTLVPEITIGSDRQRSWALDIATARVNETPLWLWRTLLDALAENNQQALFKRGTFWIDSRDQSLCKFVVIVMRHTYQTTPSVWKLVATLLYNPKNVRSEVLDRFWNQHPFDPFAVHFVRILASTFRLRWCAAQLVDAYRAIDPQADVTALEQMALEGPSMPIMEGRSIAIDLGQITMPGRVIVVMLDNGTYLEVVGVDAHTNEQYYVFKLARGGSSIVSVARIVHAFILIE